ncbi:MAG: FecR domain-containing protein [Saprospiraceae bacterium]|jgi:transmembrane sensor|nr:FecR domain-containing protein [Saprospiraceae bacterium]
MNSENSNWQEKKLKKVVSERTDKLVESLFENSEQLEKPSTETSSQMYADILNKIENPVQISAGLLENVKKRKVIYLNTRSIAAILLFLICAIFVWMWIGSNDPTIKTDFAETKNVSLPDGSKVILNANSSLTYSQDWDDTEDRKVWLEGEGYFSVAKGITKGQKFEVITKGLSVIVEGTIFNVNSRKDKVEVFLEEGKISLVTDFNNKSSKELKPGDFVRYFPKSKELKFSQKQKEIQNVSSWKDGAILFQEANLIDVLKKLTEIYGVEFEVEDKEVTNKKITAGIPVAQLDVAITMLEDVLGLEIELIGKSKYRIQ